MKATNHSSFSSILTLSLSITVNKRVQNAILGCNLKNDRMISVRFQGKPLNIPIIQVYAPTSNAEEAEVEWFCEDLQDTLVITNTLFQQHKRRLYTWTSPGGQYWNQIDYVLCS